MTNDTGPTDSTGFDSAGLQSTGHPGWPVGAATGLGPLPGTDIDEAVRTIAGELTLLPYLPELADRGVGADTVGRTLAQLTDIHAEVVPSGWRICSRPGRDARRAKDFRAWDADAAERHLAGAPMAKVQLLGPWSLAARLELPNGHRAVSDHGAVADLSASLAHGTQQYLADLERRLPSTRIVLQLDEPDLDRVLAGTVPTPSGFGTVRSIAADTVRRGLEAFIGSVETDGDNGGRACAVSGVRPGEWWAMLRDAGFAHLVCTLDDLSFDAGRLEAIGGAVQNSARLWICLAAASLPDAGRRLLAGWNRIGFSPDLLPDFVVPVGGPPPADPDSIAQQLGVARQLASALADPPESWTGGGNSR